MAAVAAEDKDVVAVVEEDKDVATAVEDDDDGCRGRRQRCGSCSRQGR